MTLRIHGSCVDVWSPDGTVRIHASLQGDLAVAVRALHQHSDATLAGQIRATARLALAALQRVARERPPDAAAGGPAR
ncbi:hypothetical protein WEI85_21085 [Actinomycetes bacterium KLBMP 9797]